jgi:hypothetical protein
VERKLRERRKWTSVLRVRRTTLSEKSIKKKRIMDMCLRVSRAHFSKLISERVIMDACPRMSNPTLHKIAGYLVLKNRKR